MNRRNLASSLEEASLAHGWRVAMCGDGISLTYEELLTRSREVARALREVGVRPHEPVMVKCSDHPLDFVAFLGVWMAGGVVAPVHRSAHEVEAAGMQGKAQCPFVLDLLAKESCTEHRLPSSGSSQDDEARRKILTDGALIILAWGSTGMPNSAVFSHTAFSEKLEKSQRLLSLTPQTVTMLVLDNVSSFGMWLALLTLLAGGRLVTRSRFTPSEFLDALVRERITFLGVSSTMIRATFSSLSEDQLAQAEAKLFHVDCLKSVVIGGAPLDKALSASLEAFIKPGVLFDIHGLTETSSCDLLMEPQDDQPHGETIGKRFPSFRHHVVNGNDECPERAPEELQLKTPQPMNG